MPVLRARSEPSESAAISAPRRRSCPNCWTHRRQAGHCVKIRAMTTVYLVDDDPLVTDSLGMALRLETPYDVRVFLSGAAALAALAENPADVVITDFKMPGMDGLELLRRLRARLPEAILMLLTGYADKDSAIQAVN